MIQKVKPRIQYHNESVRDSSITTPPVTMLRMVITNIDGVRPKCILTWTHTHYSPHQHVCDVDATTMRCNDDCTCEKAVLQYNSTLRRLTGSLAKKYSFQVDCMYIEHDRVSY